MNLTRLEGVDTVLDAFPQEIQILLFIIKGVFGRASPCADQISQTDHLINGLLAGGLGNKVFHEGNELVLGLAGVQFLEVTDQQGDHHLLPALPDEGDGSIKVKENMLNVTPFDVWVHDFNCGC